MREDDEAGPDETEIVERYFAPLAAAMPGSFGLRDDAALISPSAGMDLVVTADALVAGVHFFPDDGAADIAWKALAVNVSDLAAKGADPLAYALAAAFPGAPSRQWLAAFSGGLAEAQRAFGIGLIGGDTVATPGPLTLAITAWGAVPAGAMTPRGGAKPGDALYVTGTLGDAALGLMLRRDADAASRWGLPEAERAHLASRYLRPRPRLALAWALREYASAAMDISDGLLIDLTRMCRASGCGARIESGRLPLSDAARRAVTAEPALLRAAVAGGDDYEILIALPLEAEEPMQRIAAQMGVDIARIGMTTPEPEIWLDGAPLSPAEAMHGYRHFS